MSIKTTIMKPIEVEIATVRIEVAVRYEEEDIPNDFPLRDGDMWRATVEIDTGKILEWPTEKPEHHCLEMKVCDQGTYKLLDPNGVVVLALEGDYCPNRLIPGEYGDYINLEIEGGIVTNWPRHPNISNFTSHDDD